MFQDLDSFCSAVMSRARTSCCFSPVRMGTENSIALEQCCVIIGQCLGFMKQTIERQKGLDFLLDQTKCKFDRVRAVALESLGWQVCDSSNAWLVRTLCASLSESSEPFGLARSMAACSLAKLATASKRDQQDDPLDPAVAYLVRTMTHDTDRYVVGYCVEALERIGSSEAQAALLKFLKISRWCPMTTRSSGY
eukprot:TRINITY_DN20219_c0_g1_i7.p1 TRINITY_DN20219_c0_g1~~TRINITY_DN20219_c0_g1_i7.p1  ORF type:complete len:194 (+),score=23.70 TRINITY_DN20219_c0_g1_i7:252-833(+)